MLLFGLLPQNGQLFLCRQPFAAQPGELSSVNSHGQLLFHKGIYPLSAYTTLHLSVQTRESYQGSASCSPIIGREGRDRAPRAAPAEAG
jgi:hypothetical protein